MSGLEIFVVSFSVAFVVNSDRVKTLVTVLAKRIR